MRPLLLLTSLSLLSACSGDNLDSPIKTCKEVTTVLLGTQLPSTMQTREHQSDEAQTVVLDFQLSDQKKTMNVVCTYKTAPASDESGEALFGKFERVPSGVLINGKSTSRESLINAIHQATASAGKKAIKDANEAGLEIINKAKTTGKQIADEAKTTGKQIANDVNDFIQKQ